MSKEFHGNTTVAGYIAECLALSEKTQRQIAEECGFDNQNVITMLKNGSTKVPLNRVGSLAKALKVDPAYLLRRVMAEYMPETWVNIEAILGGAVLTANELDLIQRFRMATADRDPQTVALALSAGAVFTLVTA